MHNFLKKIIQHPFIKKYDGSIKIGLLLGWLVFIFILSNQPSLFSEVSFSIEVVLRKIAHFFVYFVLVFLFYQAFRLIKGSTFQISLLFAYLCTLLYALSDEIHQLFIPGRHGTFTDVVIDMFGALMMVVFLILEYEHQKNHPKDDHIVPL